MSIAKLRSGALSGIEAIPVEIEADASDRGDPQMVIVGLPDASVRESQHRVATAIANSNFTCAKGRMTVNLAPADVRKEGSLFDLPMAVAVLLASEKIPKPQPEAGRGLDPDTTALAGELSLGGDVRPVRGILPLAISLKAAGVKSFLVPEANAAEAAVVEGLDVYPVHSLRHAADILTGVDGNRTAPMKVDLKDYFAKEACKVMADFVEVKGQEIAKLAVQVAVAGGHNILLMGSPGTGKSMLARRIPSILPPLSVDEALAITKIHSISGLLPPSVPMLSTRPFRSPHHTVSDVGLIGGGSHPTPGEVTLAHNGVLFLDELPEFSRSVLEVMRQPLEDGFVSISRAAGSARFPSRFILVAAMNPCPCGYLGDKNHICRCTSTQIQRYRSRISGPLLDRIDLHIPVAASQLQDLQSIPTGLTSAQLREGVIRARAIQARRFAGSPTGTRTNAMMTRSEIETFCHLDPACLQLINAAITKMHYSPRSYDRILKVSRTIADLRGHDNIVPDDLVQALNFRNLDRTME